MSRSNEELAAAVQNGDRQAAHELWEGVRRFAAKAAQRWDNAFEGRNGVAVDDLINSAYIAMVDATTSYKPDKGAFLTWFAFYLKTAFCECYGLRKRQLDPLNTAQSLDAPLGDGEDGTLSDLLADPDGETPMRDAEEEIYQRQLHDALEAELDKLPEDYSTVLRMRYYDGITYREIAAATGRGTSYTRSVGGKALQMIRRSKTAQQLTAFLDFDYFHGTGLRRFKETGVSVQERYLIKLELEAQRKKPHYGGEQWGMSLGLSDDPEG